LPCMPSTLMSLSARTFINPCVHEGFETPSSGFPLKMMKTSVAAPRWGSLWISTQGALNAPAGPPFFIGLALFSFF
jgi:hypothetical protein